MGKTAAIGLIAALCGVGCGGGELSVAPASRPDANLVRAIPHPFEAGARQAPGTYVGKIGKAGWAYVGLVVRGDRALVYLCDGHRSEWFGAPVRDGRLLVRSARGTVVDAKVSGTAVSGSVRPLGQAAGAFAATRPERPGVGVFAGPDPAAPGYVRRWIVLADGIRGVSETPAPAGDAGSGAGTGTRPASAPTTSASPVTITPTPTPTPTPSETPTGVEVPAPTPTPTPPSPISDGTSNTVVIPESTDRPPNTGTRPAPTTSPAPISDGTSNTIQPGAGGGQPLEPAPDGTATPGPGPGSINDGTSNTIVIGESAGTPPAATTTPAPTVSDGTSNTIVVGDSPVNGVAEGAGTPPTPPAPPVTTCLKGAKCPPAAPPKEAPADAKGGAVAGGALLSCETIERMRRSLAGPARTDPAARRELAALTAQAKANGC